MAAEKKVLVFALFVQFILVFYSLTAGNVPGGYEKSENKISENKAAAGSAQILQLLDTALFNSRQRYLAHNRPSVKWPVKSIYPLPGAILPFKRIVAYYGNIYFPRMGILGGLPADDMLTRLLDEVKKWEKADTIIPVQPALEDIVVIAKNSAGKDGKYRGRMPFSQVEKVLFLAEKIDAIVILDVQVGLSSLQEELPLLEKYLRLPNVHLAIDPEYSMKTGMRPGSMIGSFDADDVNYAADFIAGIVRQYKIPPKILVVHRFTRKMITNYRNIILRPEVQIIMNMDGFGFPGRKIDSYKACIEKEPVQFTGFKLFYKKDTLTAGYKNLMRPYEILRFYPSPIYIQYQ